MSENSEEQLRKVYEALQDKAYVHTLMMRGIIAKPSLRAMIHMHGEKAMTAWDKFIEENPEFREVQHAGAE